MKKMLLMLAAVATLTAAARTTETSEWSYNSSEARFTDGATQIFVRPVTVDAVPVKSANGRVERASFNYTIAGDEYVARLAYNNRGEINVEQSEINLKNYLIYLASVGKLADVKGVTRVCDVFLAPIFNMAFDQNKVTIEFSGYPAVFENWGIANQDEYSKWIYYEERNPKITGARDVEVRAPIGVEQREVTRTTLTH